MIIIAIDLGIKSPAMGIWFDDGEWFYYAFLSRIRKHAHFSHPQITLLPPIPKLSKSAKKDRAAKASMTMQKYRHITDHLVANIQQWQVTEKEVRVIMEGYSFGSDSGNQFKMYELGGILKYRIETECHLPIVSYPPSRWKAWGVGKGDADKAYIVEYMKTHGPCLDFCSIFQLTIPANRKVPTPVQDLGDVSGMILAYKAWLANPSLDKEIKKTRIKRRKKPNPKVNTEAGAEQQQRARAMTAKRTGKADSVTRKKVLKTNPMKKRKLADLLLPDVTLQ
jgi:hypothetical protein